MNNNFQTKQGSIRLQFMTVTEVAEILRIKPRTIYNMVSQRRIPFRKVGRQLIFDTDEIDRWTKDCAERK